MDEQEKALRRIPRDQETLFQRIEDAERASSAESKRHELDALIWKTCPGGPGRSECLGGVLGLYNELVKYGRLVGHWPQTASERWAVSDSSGRF
jgi:hypothetical protein